MRQDQVYRSRRSYSGNDSRYEQAYVYGNAVRAPKQTPQRNIKHNARKNTKKYGQQSAAARRNQRRAMAMNRSYVLFLAIATIFCAVICCVYIQYQAENTRAMTEIASLESDLETIRQSNAILENEIANNSRLYDVKNVATIYGMAYPTKEQIVYYSVDNTDYMDQYESVPAR